MIEKLLVRFYLKRGILSVKNIQLQLNKIIATQITKIPKSDLNQQKHQNLTD